MTQKSRRKKINLSFLTHNFLFVGVAVCAPLSWSTGQNPNGKVGVVASGVILHEHTRSGGMFPHRHVDFLAFSAQLIDCSRRKLARSAQTVHLKQSLCSKKLRKFLQMPVGEHPSRASALQQKTPMFFAGHGDRVVSENSTL